MRSSDRVHVLGWHRDLYTDVPRASHRYYEVHLTDRQALVDGLEALRIERKMRGFVLVAELDGKPVGYIMAHLAAVPHRHHLRTRRPNLEGYVGEVLVDKRARRRGVGSALFQEAERRLLALGCDNLQLGVTAENTAARRFYRGVGFREFGLRLRTDISEPPRSWRDVRSKRARALGGVGY
jgi:ribosomal protein S18 acetylase RimI-like enzyme